jgi:Transposase DDE domain group 1
VSIRRGATRVEVSTTDRQITAHAGAVLLREAAEAVGLGAAVDQHVHLKKRARGLSEAEFVLGLCEAVALGAECLDDLAVARADLAQQQMRGFEIPTPQTAGTFLRRFYLGHIRQLDKALRQVHRRALGLLGPPGAVTLDFDSSYVRSRSSRRQGADPTYLKRYALHPLFCSVADYDLVLHAKLRRGRAHTAKGIDRFVDECLRRLPDATAVRARFDSGFDSERLCEHLERRGVTYLVGVSLNQRIAQVIRQIPDEQWVPCVDKDEGEVAEFGYRLARSQTFRRYVVKRIARAQGEQLDLETGGYHWWVLVTNDHRSDAAALESEHRHKAQVEGIMRELKGNLGLHVVRKHRFMANWAWLLMVVTGHNLLRWTALLGDLGGDRDRRAKRIRYRYLTVPGMLVRSARRLVLRLRSDYPLLRRFEAALSALRALSCPAIC